eukprot:CAMPEP_0195523314 /NCGR_PEP_ID=MMETSP0794_2-20130614/22321_1 /TAXON_ID=515487 /ORGANISM="Stephanopyxis turris, Strain CCMP 815" /LENGTH=288 /DNA_ID=CAMNT_0040653283 /DNA_START=55 /DNA_END=918 /DNA_ORIENTATION=-
MFGLVSGLYSSYMAPKKISILIIGCDGAGKTAFLERCKVTHFNGRVGKAADLENGNIIKNTQRARAKLFSCPTPPYYARAKVDALEPDDDNSDSIRTFDRKSHTSRVNEQTKKRSFVDNVEDKKMLPLSMIRPTVGMNLAKLNCFGTKSVLWDLGGQKQMRPLWERYYPDCDAVVFVIDGSLTLTDGSFCNSLHLRSNSKWEETKQELQKIKRDENLFNVPILVFVNKSDEIIEDDCSEDICEFIHLSLMNPKDINNGEEFNESDEELMQVFVGSAKTGHGVKVALEW